MERVSRSKIVGWFQITSTYFVQDEDKPDKKKAEKSLKIAEMLIKHGCPVDAKNEEGNTALMFALSQVC